MTQETQGGIRCPYCKTREWRYTFRSPVEPANDKFLCENGHKFQRYDAPDPFAELRMRANEVIENANATIPELRKNGLLVAMHTAVGMVAACETFLEWIDELSPP